MTLKTGLRFRNIGRAQRNSTNLNKHNEVYTMATLDDFLVNRIITTIEQDNLATQLLSLCDENLINEIKEIGSNIALDVASEMQGTNPYDLSIRITADKENASFPSNPDTTQKAKARHDKTMIILDRIASNEVAMIVKEHLRS